MKPDKPAGAGAMQEIADWLEKLGMSEYAQRFAENDVDSSVLPHLTDQSLKELGVSLGHRLKILAAIKELGSPTPAPPQRAAPTETKLPFKGLNPAGVCWACRGRWFVDCPLWPSSAARPRLRSDARGCAGPGWEAFSA
jgi:SAM domain (Sterile alpha motif)